MEVQTWDSVFIRATRRQLHPVIADPAGWSRWWPGMTVLGAGPDFALALRAPGVLRRRRRWTARVMEDRPARGIALRYEGAVAGDAEFYYSDERAGIVVHYLLRGVVADAGRRAAVRDHRVGARKGLEALKDRFERDRIPGDEPDAELLADQRRAMS